MHGMLTGLPPPEPAYRRKGLASTALQLLLTYTTSSASAPATHEPPRATPLPLPRDALVVRIGEDNEPSAALFAALGFVVTRRVAIFNEVEMRLAPGEQGEGWCKGEIKRVVF